MYGAIGQNFAKEKAFKNKKARRLSLSGEKYRTLFFRRKNMAP
jgi:hypothetical protein